MSRRHHALALLAIAALLGPAVAVAGPDDQGSGAVPSPGREDSQATPSLNVKPERMIVYAWTADGRYFVYSGHHALGYGLYSLPLFTAVISVRAGDETRLDEAAYKAWLEAHPDLGAGSEYRAGSGAKPAMPMVDGDGEWQRGRRDGTWEFHGKPGARLRCSIRRGDTLLPSPTFQVPPGDGETKIEIIWSPDERYIAWIFSGYRERPDRPTDERVQPEDYPSLTAKYIAQLRAETPDFFSELVIDRAVGPRIEITGHQALGPGAFDEAADRIVKAGFAPTGRRFARASAKAVVYAVRGWKKEAAEIAAALPGGAEVRPLAAPRNGFEVIVALARPAAPAIPGARAKRSLGG